MRYVILVGDGMGDLPIPELQGKTPLQAANISTMDDICRQGELLRLQTVPNGYPPGSDVANLSLMGYLPEEVYTGRSPLEAAAMGVTLAEDEIAFRCNLVTLGQTDPEALTMVDFSGGHITTEEASELISALNQEAAFEAIRLYPGVSYRHLLVFKGEPGAMNTVPPHDYIGQNILGFWQDYENSALWEFINKAEDILAQHPVNQKRIAEGKQPANNVWLWGEGKTPSMRTHSATYGINGALISAVDLLKGIGVYAGMDIINVPGATGYLDTNYEGKAQAALENSKDHDLVFVHVEAPDEAGHEGSLEKKIQAIEDFDSRIAKPIFQGLKESGEPFRLVVTMDHFTPLSIRTHSLHAVPVCMCDSQGEWPASGLTFDEENSLDRPLMENGALFFDKLLSK